MQLWIYTCIGRFPTPTTPTTPTTPQPSEVARRRRGRRLRSMLRHEQQTVRMALAAASTTVLDRRRKRWSCSSTPPYGDRTPAPEPGRRWCTTRTKPYGDRRHHFRRCGPAGPGAATGRPQPAALRRLSPADPRPARSGRVGRWVVDSSSLRFLTSAALRQRKEEEEEKVKREAKAQEKVVAVQQQAAAALEQARLLSSATREKRKKTRPEGFVHVRRHPFRAAEADPHGPDYSADHRVSPVAVRFRWSMPLLCWSCLPCRARVDNGSLRPRLVMLVTMRLGCVPLRCCRPRSSASWPV